MTTSLLKILNGLTNKITASHDRIVGVTGYKIFAAGAHTGLKLDSIVAGGAATTFSVYKEQLVSGTSSIDMITDRGLATVVPAGAYLPAPVGSIITTVTSDQIFIGYLSTQ